MPIIEARDVWKVYGEGPSRVEALRGVSIALEEGDFVAIMGPSGSGKSTLMHILGLLDVPTRGSVYVEGRDVSKLSEEERARIRRHVVGFVFQQFNLVPYLTALENVELPMILAGVPRAKRRERALELLRLVDVAHRAHHFPRQMSGGEQQRVAIARALANDPKVVLADEPTGNLDSERGKRVMETFTRLNRMGKTIVVVTHDPEVAAYAEKVYRIKDGRIVGVDVS